MYGDLVQLKYNKINYKIKKTLKNPLEQQVIIENHHPAIIDRQTFNSVQEMLNKKSNEWNFSDRKKHLLTGLVYCKCGSRITYNLNHGKFSRCICSSYKRYGNKFCHSIHLHEQDLIDLTASSLKKNIKQYLDTKDLKFNNLKNENKDNTKDINLLIKKKEELNKIISNLYEDKISKVISEDTFAILIKKYEDQRKEYENKIKNLQNDNTNLKEEKVSETTLELVMKELLNFNNINENNISLVFKLVDKIIINDNKIEINYKFKV